MELIKSGFDMVAAMFDVLLENREFGALVVGTLAAISITQVIKMLVIQYAPTNGGRGLWYAVTLAIGLIFTWINWQTVWGLSWGLVAGGLFAPGLYMLGTRTIYRFYPDLERHISATPRPNDRADMQVQMNREDTN